MPDTYQPVANRDIAPLVTPLTSRVIAVVALSVVIGAAYPFVAPALSPALAVVAKGAGVALLAAAAALHPSPHRWWLVAIMVAGAAGDILLELPGLFFVGAGAFAIGHLIAMAYYFQHRRADIGAVATLAAVGVIAWGLAMPTLVSPPGSAVGALMLYSVLLCGMAAALLLSRFGALAMVGALLFVVSDTLLIMRLGGTIVGSAFTHALLVWMTYYFGQAMIAVGVLGHLRR